MLRSIWSSSGRDVYDNEYLHPKQVHFQIHNLSLWFKEQEKKRKAKSKIIRKSEMIKRIPEINKMEARKKTEKVNKIKNYGLKRCSNKEQIKFKRLK